MIYALLVRGNHPAPSMNASETASWTRANVLSLDLAHPQSSSNFMPIRPHANERIFVATNVCDCLPYTPGSINHYLRYRRYPKNLPPHRDSGGARHALESTVTRQYQHYHREYSSRVCVLLRNQESKQPQESHAQLMHNVKQSMQPRAIHMRTRQMKIPKRGVMFSDSKSARERASTALYKSKHLENFVDLGRHVACFSFRLLVQARKL